MPETVINCAHCGENNRAVRNVCWKCGRFIRTGEKNNISDRNRSIVLGKRAGKSYAALAQEFGISSGRVREIFLANDKAVE